MMGNLNLYALLATRAAADLGKIVNANKCK